MQFSEFYLCSSEGYGLEEPRRCSLASPIETLTREDLLSVRVEPPLLYENQELSEVVVAARHKGVTVFNILEWPVAVHVARFNEKHGEKIAPDWSGPGRSRLQNIAWAELYPTLEEAEAAVRRPL